jgi:hypothetical protein
MSAAALPSADTFEPNAAAAETRGAVTNDEPAPSRGTASTGRYFDVDPIFLGAASVQPYERKRGDPIYRPLRIYTLDPSASRFDGAVATINVPYEELAPGPDGSVLQVLDWDQTHGRTYLPVDLDEKSALIRNGHDPSLSDAMFHQQMVYAVCSSTYNAFRVALGRVPSWGFPARPGTSRPVLRVRPHASYDENAYYDETAGELNFGYFDANKSVQGRNLPSGRVFTCLSHDIVVHEMTHALLDGLRARFRLPTNPDVLAFHEAFADLVAIFQHFSYRQVVRQAIERTAGEPVMDSLMASVAMQFGQTTDRKGPLRSAIDTAGLVDRKMEAQPKRYDPREPDPHQLGTVLVSAVFEAFSVVFRRKTKRYRQMANRGRMGALDANLAEILADEAGQLATQFLSICIRAIDYCPPVDLTFGEYLRAMITADFDLVPDDPWAYREAFIDAFARREIYPDDVPNLSEDALLWRPPSRELEPIEALHFKNLRFAGDPGRPADEAELRRQAEAVGAYVMRPDYAGEFGCALPGDAALEGDTVDPACVSSIRSLRRIGPDKEISFDLVAEVVQRRRFGTAGHGLAEFFGGSTIILAADGRVRYVIRKSVTNTSRIEVQSRHARSLFGHDGRHSIATTLRELHQRRNGRPHCSS